MAPARRWIRPSMTATAKALAAAGFRVARFEFGYMASRRTAAGRKPPPRAETLIPEYQAAVADLRRRRPADHRRQIDGRAGRQHGRRRAPCRRGRIAGLLCLGYPFHPPGRPTQTATKHLAGLETPTLICQGTRDEFGTRDEVAGYRAVADASRFCGSRTATTTSGRARVSPASPPPTTWAPWRARWRSGPQRLADLRLR